MKRVVFAVSGDVHGQFVDLKLNLLEVLDRAEVKESELSALFLVGDVEAIRSEDEKEMVHGPKKYRKMGDFAEVLSGSVKFEAPVYFIGGNHEPWSALDADGGLSEHAGNWGGGFTFLGRVGSFELEGMRVAFISGISAPEVREKRQDAAPRRRDNKKNQTYWSAAEVSRLSNLMRKRHHHILLSHEWPLGLGTDRDGNPAGSWELKKVIEMGRPELSFHGHMHHRREALLGATHATGLGHIRDGGDALILVERNENGDFRVL